MKPKLINCICIYCGKNETEAIFSSREHVIPRLLGTFNDNPTLIGWVCNHCNSTIFSQLEVRFKEDTEEGIACQMMNFNDSAEIRVRNVNSKFSFNLGTEDTFFNDVFPFLEQKDQEWRMCFVPQIKVRGYGEAGFIILIVDKIQALPRDGQKFRKIKNFLINSTSKDVSIFTQGENDPERKAFEAAKELVRELGIDYKPGTEKQMPNSVEGGEDLQAEAAIDGRIGSDVGRIIAKIAFNYFAYCAIKSNQESFLYHENFVRIKSYIIGELELPIGAVIIERPTHDPLTFDEARENRRLVGHMVTISIENGNLISQVTFAGRSVYKILLGQAPPEFHRADFGNGHVFDPFQKLIFGMTQNPAMWGSNMPLSFRLFNNG